MRKLSTDETHLLSLIAQAGGSVCPGVDANIPKRALKAIWRLVNRGDLTAEATDDGGRFTLTAQGRSDAQA